MSDSTAAATPAPAVASSAGASSITPSQPPVQTPAPKKQDHPTDNKSTQSTSSTPTTKPSNNNNKSREPKSTTNAKAGSPLPGSPKSGRSNKKSNNPAGAGTPRGQENGLRSTTSTEEAHGSSNGVANGGVGLGVLSPAGGSSSNKSSHKAAVVGDSRERQQQHPSSSRPDNHYKGGGGGGGSRWENSGQGNNSSNAPYNQHRSGNNTNGPLVSTSEARFANSRPGGGGGGGYRGNGGGAGGEEEFGRGRKFEKRAPRSHLPSSTTEQQQQQPSGGSTTMLGAPGVGEVKKSQQQQLVTRSPRSPRSPRRGFGERGSASVASVAAAAGTGQDNNRAATTTTTTTEGKGENDSESTGTELAKKRKAGRKNKKKDDDEGSVVSLSSTKEGGGDSSLDARESSGNTKKQQQSRPEDSLASISSAKEDSQQSGSNSTAWVPKAKTNRPQHHSTSDGSPNTSRPPFKNNGPPRDHDNNSKYSRNDSSKTSSYTSKNSYLGQRNGPDGRRPHHSDRGSRETSDSNDWNSGKARPTAGNNNNRKDVSRDQNGWGDYQVTVPNGGGDGESSSWTDTSLTAVQKDASQAQDGWVATPVQSESTGWNSAPPAGAWDKASEKSDSWNKAQETNDGWSHASANNERRGNGPAARNEKWGSEPAGKSEGWNNNNKASAKGQGRGRMDAPASSQPSKRSDPPTTAPMATAQTGGWDQAPVTQDKRREDSPAKTQNGGKGDAPPASGWGDVSSATTSGDGWDTSLPKATTTSTKWGESVPWETNDTSAPAKTSGWGDASQDTPKIQDSTFASSNGDDDQKRTGAGRSQPPGGLETKVANSQQGYQRGGSGSFQERRGDKRFQDADSSRRAQSPNSQSQSPRDARSSLDARNARLGIQRGPRSHEDNRTGQRGEPSEKPRGGFSRDSSNKDAPTSGSSGAAARSGQRNSGPSNQSGQKDQSNEVFQRKSPTSKGNFDKPGPGRTSSKLQKETRDNRQTPMLSNSLECQMTWGEMNLGPDVLAKIAKAGLEKPSNIQKLVMKPFKEGKDVIAQTQSQKDRTNTLAIALLEKLSSKAHTHKYPQAVVICSDGINPQRVNEDFQDWFEGVSGLGSIYLTSEDLSSEESVLSNQEQSKQVIVTTLGPLMEVLKKELVDMKFVETVVISMRAAELVNFDAFKQFWAMLPREAQVVLMTGSIKPQIQLIKTQNFRNNTAVRRADELTMQWSEHYFVDIPRQTAPTVANGDGGDSRKAEEPKDHKWEVLMQILDKNPEISHIVILTQSQSLTQALTAKLEQRNLPVLSVWSMADKTEVARQFNQPDRCILVSESLLMDSLDLNHSSLVINYEMPKRAAHYISSFGPFGRSGLRTLMINFCVKEDPSQLLSLESMEAMYDIKVREMQLD
ncbi:Eukaryotic initiation factor 4A-III [Mortierella hygrophila]|uniref:Eukaryotic initiation factor 4A-III n=1 Tax=Mortierella hygrophila TaxID=979708 RepID=A0A9P6F9J0_9FUNG|nr:Eukaryotic initiation factor 4A-III [Mortierella hygrophila]